MTGFTHLHVSSVFSTSAFSTSAFSGGEPDGSAAPELLVHRAREQGAEAAALTDSEVLSGAVRHVRTCLTAQLAPIVGVELSVRGASDRASAVTVLAHGRNAGRGWAALTRLVSAAREASSGSPGEQADAVSAGEHGYAPRLTVGRLSELVVGRDGPVASVLLGPDSDVGRAIAASQYDRARELLRAWRTRLRGAVAVEIVCHFAPSPAARSIRHAARMLELAAAEDVPAILTNEVRYPLPRDAPALSDGPVAAGGSRPLAVFEKPQDPQAWLKPADQMRRLAYEIAEHSSLTHSAAEAMLSGTAALTARCRLDPVADLGWRTLKPPAEPHDVPDAAAMALARDCGAAIPGRYPAARGSELRVIRERLCAELGEIRAHGLDRYVLVVAELAALMRHRGIRSEAHASAAGSIVGFLLGIGDVDPLEQELPFEIVPRSALSAPCTRLTPLPRFGFDVDIARRDEALQAIVEHHGPGRSAFFTTHDAPVGKGSARLRGVILGTERLLDLAPVEPVGRNLPASPFESRDLDDLGFLALDVRGSPVQSALGHAMREIVRINGPDAAAEGGLAADASYMDERGSIDLRAIPRDDEATFEAIRTGHTLGMFGLDGVRPRHAIASRRPARYSDLVSIIAGAEAASPASVAVSALTSYRAAWLKTHFPVEFLTGLFEHDSSVRRRLPAEARRMRVRLLPPDVAVSAGEYAVERLGPEEKAIRRPLTEVPGIAIDDVERIIGGRPYETVSDFVGRVAPTRALLLSLAAVGALDSLTSTDRPIGRGTVLDRMRRLDTRTRRRPKVQDQLWSDDEDDAADGGEDSAAPGLSCPLRRPEPGDAGEAGRPSAPSASRDRANSPAVAEHVIDGYRPMLDAIEITVAADLPSLGDGADVLIAGVRVAAHGPAPRGEKRRALAIGLDDGSGRADCTFAEDARRQAAPIVAGTSHLLVKGRARRDRDGGVSVEAESAWDLRQLWSAWGTGNREITGESP